MTVDNEGAIGAEVTAAVQTASPNTLPAILIVALPFSLDPGYQLVTAPDVTVSGMVGKEYTLLFIAPPTGQSSVIVKIPKASHVRETTEGRAQVLVDLSFPFMSQTERGLLSGTAVIGQYDLSIILPQQYERTAISPFPAHLLETGEKVYVLSGSDILKYKVAKAWLVFPNPMKRSLDIATMILAFMVGIFTLVFHVNSLRERNLRWSVWVLVLSVIVIVTIVMCAINLPKRLEFFGVAVGVIPHVLYGVAASSYFIFAKKRQAAITGQVRVDGVAPRFALITLIKMNGVGPQVVQRAEELKDGRYTFYCWQKEENAKYKVTAGYKDLKGESVEQEVGRGTNHEIPVIELVSGATSKPASVGQA